MNEVFEKVHDFDPTIVIIVDKAVGLVKREAAHVQLLAKGPLAKVKQDSLTFL